MSALRKLSLLIATGAIVGATAVAAFSNDNAPPRPPWVRLDGRIDVTKLPDRVPLLNSRGQVIDHVDPRTWVGSDAPTEIIEEWTKD